MVTITKEESFEIRKLFPDVKIVRTMIQKSKRSTYFCPEYKNIMEWLKKNRGVDTID